MAENALALAGQRRPRGRKLFLLRRVDLRVSEIEAHHCLHGRRGDEEPAEPVIVGNSIRLVSGVELGDALG